MSTVIFLRHKTLGQNSIEELAASLQQGIGQVVLKTFPAPSVNIWGMLKNIVFAIKHAGEVNHLSAPVESYVLPFIRGKKIVTWHDVSTALQSRSRLKKFLRFNVSMRWPMRYADFIVAISESTRRELESIYPQGAAKIRVIPNSYNRLFTYTPARSAFEMHSPVILHIGTAKRKNLERVIPALEGIECILRIVGRLSADQTLLLDKHQISFTQESDVSLERIIELYRESDIISFPSLYEGFGMPIIEAGAIGRPVVSSRAGAIPEIAQDSVCYVDPEDISSIRSGFLRVIHEENYRKELIEKGRSNAQRYSPAHMCSAYADLYESLSR